MPIQLKLKDVDLFDGSTSQFVVLKGGVFTFEHSLLSLVEWESKYKKPLLDRKDKTVEEFVDYILMMELSRTLDVRLIDTEVVNTLSAYIVDNQSATVIKPSTSSGSSSFITSESIYASMAMAQVPYSAETWNLNRLLTTLAIIGEKSNPNPKKKSKREVMSEYKSLNQKRREATGGKG